MKILFISDYVCPYCLVAKEAMKKALEETGIEAEITWQPFELTIEPAQRIDTYHDEVRKSHYQILVEPCKQLELDMKLPPAVVPRPYTLLAFEGYYEAIKQGKGDAYNERMYKAYFIEEQDIGELNVLCELAKEVGLDVIAYKNALEQGTHAKKLQEMNQYGRNVQKIKHVPTILIDDEEISLESYTSDEFVKILQGIRANEQNEEGCGAEINAGGCGPEGCGAEINAGGCGPEGCGAEINAGGCGPDGCSF